MRRVSSFGEGTEVSLTSGPIGAAPPESGLGRGPCRHQNQLMTLQAVNLNNSDGHPQRGSQMDRSRDLRPQPCEAGHVDQLRALDVDEHRSVKGEGLVQGASFRSK